LLIEIKSTNKNHHLIPFKVEVSLVLVLIPVILAIWEAEIRRILDGGRLRQTVCEIPSRKVNRAK
jgi:hypothetical protein